MHSMVLRKLIKNTPALFIHKASVYEGLRSKTYQKALHHFHTPRGFFSKAPARLQSETARDSMYTAIWKQSSRLDAVPQFRYSDFKRSLAKAKSMISTIDLQTNTMGYCKPAIGLQPGITHRNVLRPLRADITFAVDGTGSRQFSEDSGFFRTKFEDDHFKRELHTINVAVIVNLVIFIAKLGACYMTRSSSMFAEAVHSLADVGNQMLLRTGVVQAIKGPTDTYNYGFTREKFVWSLISAVGVFFLGAGVSLFNGIQGLWEPREIENLTCIFWVLGASFVLEGYSFLVAVRTVMHHARLSGTRFMDYVLLGRDPTPIAVMFEDCGAVLGIIIAGISTVASHYTNNNMWDSVGSIVIGVLMAFVATFLIKMNRSFLIGRSISKKEIGLILKTLREDPVVKHVYDCKSEEIGPGRYRFKAEIDFCGEVVVERHLQALDQEKVLEKLRYASWSKDNRSLQMALKDYGKELVSQVGAEVDRLEMKIRKAVPGVVHVDLEVDRGRIEKKQSAIISN